MARATKISTTSVFGAAPVIAAAKPASKSKAEEIFYQGVEDYAALDAVIKALLGYKADAEAKLKAAANETFIARGLAGECRPENFKGQEGIGTASIQLRASSSRLSDEAIEEFEEHGIALDKQEIVVETFVIAPEYANDPAFVQKLEASLGEKLVALQDERGAIIQKQEGVSKTTVSEAGLQQIFTKGEDIVRKLVPVAFTTAVLAKLKNGDLRPALKLVDARYFSEPKDETAEEAPAATATAKPKKTKAA
jgi:hypothetical protein